MCPAEGDDMPTENMERTFPPRALKILRDLPTEDTENTEGLTHRGH